MSFSRKIIYTLSAASVGLYFMFIGLVAAKSFLVPIVTAIVLALLMIPLSNKMESWGLHRVFTSFISTLILMVFMLMMGALVFFQAKSFIDDRQEIKEAMQPKITAVEKYLIENTVLEEENIASYKDFTNIFSFLKKAESGKMVLNAAWFIGGFLTNTLLMFVYIFFLLRYRTMFKKFILKLFDNEKSDEVSEVISKTATISQQYLFGRLILMLVLAVFYAIGLGLSGVSNFILISLIAAVLSLIPFVGNLIGLIIALAFGFLTTGETTVLIGVVLTFAITQFLETYILQPYVLGDKVNVHPLFIILSVILGNMVWGVMGMVLAIPLLGIINITFNHIKELKPLGYLLSNSKEE